MKGKLICLLVLSLSININVFGLEYKVVGGTAPGLEGKSVMLFKFKGKRVAQVDTTVISNGTFQFIGHTDSIQHVIITCGTYPESIYSAKLLLEEGAISVRLGKHSTIGGTPLNNLYQGFLSNYYALDDSMDCIQRKSPNVENEKRHRDLRIKRDDLLIDFIKDNNKNPLGFVLLKDQFIQMNLVDFEKICKDASGCIKNDAELNKYYHWKKKRDAEFQKTFDDKQKLFGKKYTDFKFVTTTGETKMLSDFVGKSKYIMLDFWASWCGPCMEEQVYIKEIYEKYKSEGLEIIGISLDDNAQLWKDAIKKAQATWPQLCDLKAGESGIKKAYYFIGIPHTVVLDQSGKIINSCIFGREDLGAYFSYLFKK